MMSGNSKLLACAVSMIPFSSFLLRRLYEQIAEPDKHRVAGGVAGGVGGVAGGGVGSGL